MLNLLIAVQNLNLAKAFPTLEKSITELHFSRLIAGNLPTIVSKKFFICLVVLFQFQLFQFYFSFSVFVYKIF